MKTPRHDEPGSADCPFWKEIKLDGTVIGPFSGEFDFLSNFYPAKIVLSDDGIEYRSVEHAYQAWKFAPGSRQRLLIQASSTTPGQAKRIGAKAVLAPRAEVNPEGLTTKGRVKEMFYLLIQKFSHSDNPELHQKILDTGHARLVEVNSWGDTFWGVCGGVGENKLGDLLMLVREAQRIVRGREKP